MRKPSRLVLVLACLAFAVPAYAQKAEFRVGDVLVAVGGGSYQQFHSNGSTYVSEGAIVGSTTGITAGCAIDATYHLISTDFTVPEISSSAVDRWAMNGDPNTSHSVIQTLSLPAGVSNPTSVVSDSAGNLYAGTADGNGLVVEYPLSNGVFGTPVTLPLTVASITGGAPFIDLSADGTTIYFTNGGGTVKSFAVSSSTVSTFASGPTALTHLFGLRVVPSTGDLLVAAGAHIYLFGTNGNLLQTYTVPNESNFQYVTLDPNGTSFWAGNPNTKNFYRINLDTGAVEAGTAGTGGTLTASGPISGICAYGDFHAAQAQPVSLGTKSLNISETVLFSSPVENDSNTTLKVTFALAASGTTQPASLGLLKVTGLVTEINPAAGYSDAISSTPNFPASNPLPCTPDTAAGGKCLVWALDDNTDPTGAIPPPYSTATYAFSQAGADGNTRLIRDGSSNITQLVTNLDPGGQTRGTSGYSLNQIPATQTPDAFCGFGNNLGGSKAFKFGSAIPFKFAAATSSANCAAGITIQNLTSNFGAPFLTLWQLPSQAGASAGSPVSDVIVSGQSGVPPIYRPDNKGNYILNLKTSSLTPGACYIATTFANEISSEAIHFCLTSN